MKITVLYYSRPEQEQGICHQIVFFIKTECYSFNVPDKIQLQRVDI